MTAGIAAIPRRGTANGMAPPEDRVGYQFSKGCRFIAWYIATGGMNAMAASNGAIPPV
jgi:hypothetical protein